MGFFNFYRTHGVEWAILVAFLSYSLFIVSGPKNNRLKGWLYASANMAVFFLCYPIVHRIPFTPVFATQSIPIWYCFVISAIITLVLSHIFLSGSLFSKVCYVCFYMVFILLAKMVCSPLYGNEEQMLPRVYIFLDFITQLLLFLLLFLLSYLFQKVRLSPTTNFLPRVYQLAMYFPLSFFIYYLLLSTNQEFLNLYSAPLLAGIILTNLPIVYYIFATIVRTYEERIQLDRALTETKAQLARYSYSIELEERLKQERHELKNNYFYIRSLLNEQKYDKLQEYLDGAVAEKMEALTLVSTGNAMIDYLLNCKLQQAHQYQIKTYTEVLLPEQLPIDDHIFCTILLNLLDNAIEASRQEKNADIHITMKCVQNYLTCEIKNKIGMDVLAQNPTLRTTKPDAQNHGFGIRIIRDAIKKNNGIFQTSVEDGYFKAVVMLLLER